MSDKKEEGEKHKRTLLVNRLRRRRITLLNRVHKFHQDFGAQIYTVIYCNCKFHVYSSQSNELWPPPLNEIKGTYPIPAIHIAEAIKPHQRTHNDSENYRSKGGTSLLPGQIQNSASALRTSSTGPRRQSHHAVLIPWNRQGLEQSDGEYLERPE